LINSTIEIYTDGSCHTQFLIGAWVAIIFVDGEKIILSGVENNTTHNRMEIIAVNNALHYIEQQNKIIANIKVVTDSQYVVGLQDREQKFTANNYLTKKGNEISNADVIKIFLNYCTGLNVQFIKIKAHQKPITTINYNIDADKLSRNLVRQAVKNINS